MTNSKKKKEPKEKVIDYTPSKSFSGGRLSVIMAAVFIAGLVAGASVFFISVQKQKRERVSAQSTEMTVSTEVNEKYHELFSQLEERIEGHGTQIVEMQEKFSALAKSEPTGTGLPTYASPESAVLQSRSVRNNGALLMVVMDLQHRVGRQLPFHTQLDVAKNISAGDADINSKILELESLLKTPPLSLGQIMDEFVRQTSVIKPINMEGGAVAENGNIWDNVVRNIMKPVRVRRLDDGNVVPENPADTILGKAKRMLKKGMLGEFLEVSHELHSDFSGITGVRNDVQKLHNINILFDEVILQLSAMQYEQETQPEDTIEPEGIL